MFSTVAKSENGQSPADRETFRAIANDRTLVITFMTCEVNLKNVYGASSAFTRTGRFDRHSFFCAVRAQKQFSCRSGGRTGSRRRRQNREWLKTSFVHNGLANTRRVIKKQVLFLGGMVSGRIWGGNCLWQGELCQKKWMGPKFDTTASRKDAKAPRKN